MRVNNDEKISPERENVVIQVSVGMENIRGSNLHSPGSNGSFRDTLTFPTH
jgi:hypothetical protein